VTKCGNLFSAYYMTVRYLEPPHQCNCVEKNPSGKSNISYIVKGCPALYGQHSTPCSKMPKIQRPSGKILQAYIRHKKLFTYCWLTIPASPRNIICETHFTSCSTHKSRGLFFLRTTKAL